MNEIIRAAARGPQPATADFPVEPSATATPKDAAQAKRVAASMRAIPSLDGLRAVSFLVVFCSHAWGDFFPGGFGVTVFFFLSGFLITTLMRDEYLRTRHVNLAHFWIRRALRILPPFYIVLAGTTLWTALSDWPGKLSMTATLARALHVTNYWVIYHGQQGEPVGTTLYWSLAVEEHFYLIFPWLYLFMRRRRFSPRDQAGVLWTLCIAFLLWRCYLTLIVGVPDNRIAYASDTRMDSILFGCALAVWHNPVLDRQTFKPWLWKYGVFPASLLVLVVSLLVSSTLFRETVRYTIQGAALTLVFISAIRLPDWPPFRILNWKPVQRIGLLSYSLYLMHYAVILVVSHDFPMLGKNAAAAVSFGISLGLAWLLYVSVERPCARLRRRLTD